MKRYYSEFPYSNFIIQVDENIFVRWCTIKGMSPRKKVKGCVHVLNFIKRQWVHIQVKLGAACVDWAEY